MTILPDLADMLILGITGGIASGKSTVVEMMREFGAAVIDFDLLAREVVAPEKPAWQEIVGYFGTRVLLENSSLDRKKLSRLVFPDPEKRKKLESITHPRIMDLYVSRVRKIARKEPGAVVLAVIPLLFEANLEDLVHKILVVYIPKEIQMERLMKRDAISREQAENMLKAQLLIDAKMKKADFVIRNEKGLEETRRQVTLLWQTLKREQERRKENG
jgi:dephospho-CoA kinase